MGKKGSWFSLIKRLIACNIKKRLTYGSTKKKAKEKKKARKILRPGEIKSFLFREPSSIEKILGELDEQNRLVRPPTSEHSNVPSAIPVRPTSPRVSSPRAASPQTSTYRATSPSATSPSIASPKASSPSVSSPKDASPRATSPKAASPRATAPKAASPRVTAPKPASLRATAPKPASPRATTPKAASPRATAPKTASPRATAPKAASPRATSPSAASQRATSPRAASPRDSSPRATYPEVSRNHEEISYADNPEPTLTLHLSATKIQAAFRRYMARRSIKSLTGFARLQGLVRSRSVKRQTVNAMKQMQFLVRVQMQIHSRRTQMLENQALQSQAHRDDKEVESTLSKWSDLTEADDDWDNSTLTKEEVEARRRAKVEAAIKRERAMTYAYSHQLSKSNAKSAVNIRAGRIPWWWNWLDHQVPSGNDSESQSVSKSGHLTPRSSISVHKPTPRRLSHNFRYLHSGYDHHESVTPRSTKSAVPLRGIQMLTPRRASPLSSSSTSNYPKRRASAANSPFYHSLKDDDSLMSCPPFSIPHYMSPTMSAKAKVRGKSIPENTGTPSNGSRRRLSFPSTPNSEASKWNRGSGKDASSQREHESEGDHMSVGSAAVSMPAVVGRRPFKRFV